MPSSSLWALTGPAKTPQYMFGEAGEERAGACGEGGEPVSATGSCKLSQEIEAALCPVALGLATTRPQTHRSGN